MTALQAMRWTLVGNFVLYGLGLALGHELGAIMAIFGTLAIVVSAVGCVILQLIQRFGRRQHKPVEELE